MNKSPCPKCPQSGQSENVRAGHDTPAGSAGPSRRKFVDWVLGTGAGGLFVAALYPVFRYVVPPQLGETAAKSVVLPFSPDAVAPNSGKIFKFGNEPGIILRTPDGDLRAFSAVCTHLGCIVQYRPDLSHIWCACHNGHYNLRGINIKGPPPRPLPEWTVKVRGEQIRVSREPPSATGSA
jgi:cytochrome b6-f complex iron-sulfur subunit